MFGSVKSSVRPVSQLFGSAFYRTASEQKPNKNRPPQRPSNPPEILKPAYLCEKMTCVVVLSDLRFSVFPVNLGRTASAAFSSRGEGFRQGGHRFGAAANTLVDEALFDAAPFDEAGSTLRGMLRNQNSPN